MSGALAGPQGLYITTRYVHYDPKTRRLVRTSEIGVVTAFGPNTLDVAQTIRANGLKVGMRFRGSHRVSSVTFTAGPAGMPVPPAGAVVLAEDPLVTDELEGVFGSSGRWIGYTLPGAQIPLPTTWTTAQDRLFFTVTLDRFHSRHALDCHVVPVVAVLASMSFANHYVLGIGTFAIGKGHQSIEFDSQVIATM